MLVRKLVATMKTGRTRILIINRDGVVVFYGIWLDEIKPWVLNSKINCIIGDEPYKLLIYLK